MLGNVLGGLLGMNLGASGSQTQNPFSLGGCANALPAGMGSGMANNSLSSLGGGHGGAVTTTISTDIYGNTIPPSWHSITIPAASPFPQTTFETTGMFRIQKVANGYLVDLVRYSGGVVETHYCEGYKEAGELITAHLVKWELEGKK